jgi:hypothetical protein
MDEWEEKGVVGPARKGGRECEVFGKGKETQEDNLIPKSKKRYLRPTACVFKDIL